MQNHNIFARNGWLGASHCYDYQPFILIIYYFSFLVMDDLDKAHKQKNNTNKFYICTCDHIFQEHQRPKRMLRMNKMLLTYYINFDYV